MFKKVLFFLLIFLFLFGCTDSTGKVILLQDKNISNNFYDVNVSDLNGTLDLNSLDVNYLTFNTEFCDSNETCISSFSDLNYSGGSNDINGTDINVGEFYSRQYKWSDINYSISIGTSSSPTLLYSTAFGYGSGYLNSNTYQTVFGTFSGQSNSGRYQSAFGYQAGQGNIGIYQSALGKGAGLNNTGSNQTVFGIATGENNSGNDQTAFGYGAGKNNSGAGQIAIGYNAGKDNTKLYQTAIGYGTGVTNTGTGVTGVGSFATQLNTRNYVTGVGYIANSANTGLGSTSVGYSSCSANSGDYATGIGYNALNHNSGIGVTGIGRDSGSYNSGDYLTAIGQYAGQNQTSTASSTIGYYSGYNAKGDYSLTMGSYSGMDSNGDYAVSLGYNAGRGIPSTAEFLIGIGYYANRYSTGTKTISIGKEAGYENTGNNCIFIGEEAGKDNTENDIFEVKQTTANDEALIRGDIGSQDINLNATTWTRNIKPQDANTYDIGSGAYPYQDIYLKNTPTVQSDGTLKQNIQNTDLGLDFLNQLNPVSFEWIQGNGEKHYGFIAQEISSILDSNPDKSRISFVKEPRTIIENKDVCWKEKTNCETIIIDKETEEVEIVCNETIKCKTITNTEQAPAGIQPMELIPILTKAIQEQQETIEHQQTQLTELELRISKLEKESNIK